jgi:hypothetical protein
VKNPNSGGDLMNDNILPFKKSDRFEVYRAGALPSGELVEKEKLGLAFLKPGAKMFRLNLWMFPNEQYFIAANEDRTKYKVLCPNDYGGEVTHWKEVGTGRVSGPFIRLKFHLLGEDILVCLYPKVAKSEVTHDAA